MGWLVGGWTTHLKNIRELGSFPQVGVKIPKIFELPPPSLSLWHWNLWNFWVVDLALNFSAPKGPWFHHNIFGSSELGTILWQNCFGMSKGQNLQPWIFIWIYFPAVNDSICQITGYKKTWFSAGRRKTLVLNGVWAPCFGGFKAQQRVPGMFRSRSVAGGAVGRSKGSDFWYMSRPLVSYTRMSQEVRING